MNRLATYLAGILLLFWATLGVSCSQPAQPQKAAPTGQSQPSAQTAPAEPAPAAQAAPAASTPAAAPAAAETAAAPAGTKSAEKHKLNLTNYAGIAVTVTLNGAWIGQWDTHTSAPLDAVVVGKNELVVELADEAKNQLQVEVNVERDGRNVNLLRLNFQGKKTGKYTYNFVAK